MAYNQCFLHQGIAYSTFSIGEIANFCFCPQLPQDRAKCLGFDDHHFDVVVVRNDYIFRSWQRTINVSKIGIDYSQEALYTIMRFESFNGLENILLPPSRDNRHFGIFDKSAEKFLVIISLEDEHRSIVCVAYEKNFIGNGVACLIHNVSLPVHLPT